MNQSNESSYRQHFLEQDSKIKPQFRLQCPECGSVLEKAGDFYLCPVGHIKLNTTLEGYPILNGKESLSKDLTYGGDFKEGICWHNDLGRCRKIVYVSLQKEENDEIETLREYLSTMGHELNIILFNELNTLNKEDHTLIIFGPRIGRKNMVRLLSKSLRYPVYRYVSGSLIQVRLPKLIRHLAGVLVYKFFLHEIVSRSVNALYEQFLYNPVKAEDFAQTYLPPEIRNKKEAQVFDLGCGRGRHVAMLTQLGFTVTAMDLHPHPYWKRIPTATFIIGSAECLPYIPDASFDFVACMQVLMYVRKDDLILAQIRRILRKEGHLLLQVTNKDNLHTFLTNQPLAQDPHLQRYYNQSDLCGKLQKHGFTIDRVWTEKLYTPFWILPGNILYEFVLNRPLKGVFDRLVDPKRLGLINILGRPS